eukprot:TRINITY_DN1388_c0_g1_i2.p1 TRINITY_DN1388_c0_g1~~TRINITY_DN1388_c0_g1_i2.p1  ORF type:complete len:361 (+),score=42.78 TRINITY_DN1388_c0_g1_i2:130-1212(+)
MYLKFRESEVNATRAWREWVAHEKAHEQTAKTRGHGVCSLDVLGAASPHGRAAPWATGTVAQVSAPYPPRRGTESSGADGFSDITTSRGAGPSIGRLDRRVDKLSRCMHNQLQQNEEILATLRTLQHMQLPPCHASRSTRTSKPAASRTSKSARSGNYWRPQHREDNSTRSSPVLTPTSTAADIGFPDPPGAAPVGPGSCHAASAGGHFRPRRSTSLVHAMAPSLSRDGSSRGGGRRVPSASGRGSVGDADLLHAAGPAAPSVRAAQQASSQQASQPVPNVPTPTPPPAAPRNKRQLRARIFDAAGVGAVQAPSKQSAPSRRSAASPRPPSGSATSRRGAPSVVSLGLTPVQLQAQLLRS